MELRCENEIKVRFSEVDSMRIVWHGNYVQYFEDGRDHFGKLFNLDTINMSELGFLTPVVDCKLEFKKPLRCGDVAVIKTKFIDHSAAKIIFEYRIENPEDGSLYVSGKTTQVFVDMDFKLQLYAPEFFSAWKKKHGLIKK